MTRKKSAPAGQRQLRVGEELRHALSSVLAEDHLVDPDLRGKTVTVTEVRISPDFANATAFVSLLFGQGDIEQNRRTIAALNRAAGYFRGRLAAMVKLRVSPKFRFALDESFQRAERIETLLKDPAVKRDLAAERDHGAEPDDGA